jgi:hypothetical protein
MKKRPMSAHGTDVERRKNRRFPVLVPLEVSWQGADGIALKEDAVARQVNANGGFLKMSSYPAAGARVTLANFLSAQTAEARVLAAPDSRPGVANGIVVELIAPNESFWGVDLQVNKTIVELQLLEDSLNHEDIDVRLVREYREAMDLIRSTTETLQRVRTSKLQPSDDRELPANLAADRIQRTSRLCTDVIADCDAGRVRPDTKGLEELVLTIKHLNLRLKKVTGLLDSRVNSSFEK